VVRDKRSDEIVGTCRVLIPGEARRAGGYCIEKKFDVALLEVLRDRMVEVSGVQVHPDHRAETVMPRLWSTLASFLIETRHDYVIASPCVSLADGGHAAASIYRSACLESMSPEDYRVYPRRRLALEALRETPRAAPPALLEGYLALGAWVCGEPAWDAEFDCAEFPLLLPLSRMRGRHARSFLARAA
jgi:putative hemolysin